MDLKFQVQAKINKPRNEVFDAVYDPKKLSGYFTTGGASGPLDEGKTVIWQFADFPGDIPVTVKNVVPGERIELEWAASEYAEFDMQEHKLPTPAGYNTKVVMTFESLTPQSTLVKIAESGWRPTQGALNSSYGNCQGWMHMACCLKVWAEHGINLREGFF